MKISNNVQAQCIFALNSNEIWMDFLPSSLEIAFIETVLCLFRLHGWCMMDAYLQSFFWVLSYSPSA